MRRQAAVDEGGIDPWHLAATIEGLRLQFGDATRLADRGAIFDAARHAQTLRQRLQDPDFEQEGEVQQAAENCFTPKTGLSLWSPPPLAFESGSTPARPARLCDRPLCGSGYGRGCSARPWR